MKFKTSRTFFSFSLVEIARKALEFVENLNSSLISWDPFDSYFIIDFEGLTYSDLQNLKCNFGKEEKSTGNV